MFKDYQSKPVVRKAHEVSADDLIGKVIGEDSTSELVLDGDKSGIKFKHYEPVNTGDFIVYLNDDDIYHCTRAVFLERNVVPACKGIDLGDGNYSGCNGTGGDCPTCGQ